MVSKTHRKYVENISYTGVFSSGFKCPGVEMGLMSKIPWCWNVQGLKWVVPFSDTLVYLLWRSKYCFPSQYSIWHWSNVCVKHITNASKPIFKKKSVFYFLHNVIRFIKNVSSVFWLCDKDFLHFFQCFLCLILLFFVTWKNKKIACLLPLIKL